MFVFVLLFSLFLIFIPFHSFLSSFLCIAVFDGPVFVSSTNIIIEKKKKKRFPAGWRVQPCPRNPKAHLGAREAPGVGPRRVALRR
jgi:hypothetical protein